MLTTEGKNHIRRYMGGLVPSIAQSLAIGVGDTPESASHERLQFETSRADLLLTSFDFINSRLVFKAPISEDIAGEIREVGIYSTATDESSGEFGSILITTFDSNTEDWNDVTTTNDSTFTINNTRIGVDSLRQTPAANGSQTDTLQELLLDLSDYSAADKFVFAFYVGNSNASSVRFRFMTDTSNYYDISVGSLTTGYKIVESTKSNAVATGSPDWGNITEIRVTTFASAGGAAAVNFDGIRIEDVDSINPDYVLIAREVLSTPFVKQEGKVQEIEFSLDINL